MTNSNYKTLWSPSKETKKNSNLFEFIYKYVRVFENTRNMDFQSILSWSLQNPEKFWDYVWDYSKVIGTKGKILLKDKDKMPGAKFFPDSKINYAENILGNKDNMLAIISAREDGLKCKITMKELRKKVLQMAGYLKENGIKKGDRVCAYMPNCPETIITMQRLQAL